MRRSVSSRSRKTIASTAVVVCLALGLAPGAHAQSEDQIKAAFLFNFARYVEWPEDAFESPESAIRICLVGSRAFAGVVEGIVSGKSVGTRSVEVRRGDDLSAVDGCHILFVGSDLATNPGSVADRVSTASVLTVADQEGFASGGGMANFIRAESKVRFEINPGAAEKAGLKISSRLLRLAKVVE